MQTDMIREKGTVVEVLRDSKFVVELEQHKMKLNCTISGKLRQNNIRIITGDMVDVDISPYDLTKGRIVWRYNTSAPVIPDTKYKKKKR